MTRTATDLAEQLAFDLPHRPAMGRADFLVSAGNAAALAALDAWRGWPNGRMILVGPAGAGKTHLAQVWTAATGARLLAAADLPGLDPVALAANPVALEDAEVSAACPEALFHLINALAAAGRPLLMTATRPPRDWGIPLPDLASRLSASALLRLEPPDDALLAAVLVKLFADRQIAVPANVIAYALPRIERSLAAARDFVARIDAASLAQGRPVTRRLAASLLDPDQPELDLGLPQED